MPDFLTALRSLRKDVVHATPRGPVIEPMSTEDTALVLRLATEYGARLAPPGAGQDEDRIPVDLRRMAAVVGYDAHAQLVRVEAGISLAALVDDLRRRGRALPIRREPAGESLGAFLARGAPGARSKDDDPVDQLVAGLTAVLPDGRILEVRPAPRRAVGPDLASALVGARGALGIITAVHVVTHARRPVRELHFLFPTRDDAEIARAQLRGRGVRPELADVVDAPEGAALFLCLGGEPPAIDTIVSLARDVSRARRGVEVSAREVAPLPPPPPSPVGDIVAELARTIDPGGVLSPR